MNDQVIYFGGEVKSLGNGKIGGQLITFGDATKTDLVGDFFTDTTDFDVDFSGEVKSSVYYNHGLDTAIGRKKLGGGQKAILTNNGIGIWIEAQLDERNEYEKAILNLVEQKKMGWSSGTASHVVQREAVGNAMHIKNWALGVDASITPTPCEYRNTAVPLKSIHLASLKSLITNEDGFLGDDVIEATAFAASCSIWERFMYRGLWEIIYSDVLTQSQKIEKINGGIDEMSVTLKAVIGALLALAPDELAVQYGIAKSLHFEEDVKTFNSLREHIEFVNDAVKNLADRINIIKEVSTKSEVKKGAVFNGKNTEYLLSVAEKMVSDGTAIKDLVQPKSDSATSGKSLNTDWDSLIKANALSLHELEN